MSLYGAFVVGFGGTVVFTSCFGCWTSDLILVVSSDFLSSLICFSLTVGTWFTFDVPLFSCVISVILN